MKKTICFLLVICFIIPLCGCCLFHDWQDATCTNPMTCAKCGKTKGDPLGHTWVEATCAAPKTCSVCGKVVGASLPHSWIEATCTAPKTCSVCGETEGRLRPHQWLDATCTEPQICSVCGKVNDKSYPTHKWVEATCTTPKTCSVCGETVGKPNEDHIIGRYTVIKKPSCEEEGLQSGVCNRCGKTIETRIPPQHEELSDWTIIIEPTKTSKGKAVRTCLKCGEEAESSSVDFPVFTDKELREIAIEAVKKDLQTRTDNNGVAYKRSYYLDKTTYNIQSVHWTDGQHISWAIPLVATLSDGVKTEKLKYTVFVYNQKGAKGIVNYW